MAKESTSDEHLQLTKGQSNQVKKETNLSDLNFFFIKVVPHGYLRS